MLDHDYLILFVKKTAVKVIFILKSNLKTVQSKIVDEHILLQEDNHAISSASVLAIV